MNNNYIDNIKKSSAFRTKINSDHLYSDLWYGDRINKICFTFSPRGGCSISFQCFLDLVNLLEDALNYDKFIHNYRNDILDKNILYIDINQLIKENYIFIKFIMNPYIRAVSSFRVKNNYNITFREYLKNLINNKIDFFDYIDRYHSYKQYIDGEKQLITKYICINENDEIIIRLKNNKLFKINPNNYSSIHHGIKTTNNNFCGDTLKDEINNKLPLSYKYFYDDEIKKLVETYYKDDIEQYSFTFELI